MELLSIIIFWNELATEKRGLKKETSAKLRPVRSWWGLLRLVARVDLARLLHEALHVGPIRGPAADAIRVLAVLFLD